MPSLCLSIGLRYSCMCAGIMSGTSCDLLVGAPYHTGPHYRTALFLLGMKYFVLAEHFLAFQFARENKSVLADCFFLLPVTPPYQVPGHVNAMRSFLSFSSQRSPPP